ncbi:MAG: hypothetical protein ABEI06_03185 [Halobacteriaceae archaeon]
MTDCVRDAVASDCEEIATIADASENTISRMIHEREVRVYECDGSIQGFLAFDTWQETVQITRFVAEPENLRRLLEDPIQFGKSEQYPIEIIVPQSNTEIRSTLTEVGFAKIDTGPRFSGESTDRYRLATN